MHGKKVTRELRTDVEPTYPLLIIASRLIQFPYVAYSPASLKSQTGSGATFFMADVLVFDSFYYKICT